MSSTRESAGEPRRKKEQAGNEFRAGRKGPRVELDRMDRIDGMGEGKRKKTERCRVRDGGARRAPLRYLSSLSCPSRMAFVSPWGGWGEPSSASRHDRGHERVKKRKGRLGGDASPHHALHVKTRKVRRNSALQTTQMRPRQVGFPIWHCTPTRPVLGCPLMKRLTRKTLLAWQMSPLATRLALWVLAMATLLVSGWLHWRAAYTMPFPWRDEP